MQRTAIALQSSGYFKDVASQAQAIVKVMAGAELGLPPFASMAGIHIVQGKPVLGSNVIATLVKNDPRYDYRVKIASDKECVLTWYEDGRAVGEAGFTIAEATAAGLTGKQTWKAYPSDMLFARAISRGARRFAPGIFGGAPVYTPDEMGVDVNEDGYVIEGEIVESQPEPPRVVQPAPVIDNTPTPEPQQNGNGNSSGLVKLSDKTRRKLHAVGSELYGAGEPWDSKRADMSAAFEVASSNDWTEEQAAKVIAGMQKRLDEKRGEEIAAVNEELFPE
jgi:hypothetical protein